MVYTPVSSNVASLEIPEPAIGSVEFAGKLMKWRTCSKLWGLKQGIMDGMDGCVSVDGQKKSTIRFWGTFSDKPNMRIVYRKCWFWVNKRTKITRTYHPRKQDANVFRKNLFHLGREPWSFWVPRKYRNLFAPSPKRRCIRGPRWRTIFQNLDWWPMGILFSWLLIASLAQETF